MFEVYVISIGLEYNSGKQEDTPPGKLQYRNRLSNMRCLSLKCKQNKITLYEFKKYSTNSIFFVS